MNNEPIDQTTDDIPIFKRLRNSVFPEKPTDAAPVKILKQSAFYLFAVMVVLITVVIGGAIMFVL